MKKILFICPYPHDFAPSQRFRYEQYLKLLSDCGYYFNLKPFFLTPSVYLTIYRTNNALTKIALISYCYLRRFLILLHVGQYDFVFIHREATPAGPPIIEWCIAKIFRKKIIYDFDDAIWLTDNVSESAFHRILRFRHKIGFICKWSYKISCGNRYLAAYASKFNPRVVINPTTIDTVNVHLSGCTTNTQGNPEITIGWTGSRSTLKYLRQIESVLQKLSDKYPFVRFLVIADKSPALDLKNLTFKTWSKETEIDDLNLIDIGIMPLPDDEWTKGKCGFKALQYMALEIPAVVSPVGVNSEIIHDGVEGFLCQSDEEWFTKLEYLILHSDKRLEMGKRGRETVIERYSVQSNFPNFLSLFQ